MPSPPAGLAPTTAARVRALTGDLVPYVPPPGLAAVVGGAGLLAPTATIRPVGRLRRVPPLEHLGVRERPDGPVTGAAAGYLVRGPRRAG